MDACKYRYCTPLIRLSAHVLCVCCQEALSHPYLADYHYPEDEPTAPKMIDIDFEKQAKMSKQELQMRMIRYAWMMQSTSGRDKVLMIMSYTGEYLRF